MMREQLEKDCEKWHRSALEDGPDYSFLFPRKGRGEKKMKAEATEENLADGVEGSDKWSKATQPC